MSLSVERNSISEVNAAQSASVSATNGPVNASSLQPLVSKKTYISGLAGTVGSAVGQLAGRGYVIRVGSNYVYNAVYAKAIASTPWYLGGKVSAVIAANSAVGAATPALAVAGTAAGGVLLGVATTVAVYAACRLGETAINRTRSAVNNYRNPSVIQANVTLTSIKAKEAEDIDCNNGQYKQTWKSPYSAVKLTSLQNPRLYTKEV